MSARENLPLCDRPIGVFDSGLGGLSALREIHACMPGENLIYFGDTGRVPYGTKSQQTIRTYAEQDMRFLAGMQPKAIVIACGTVSSVAPDACKEMFSGTVLGVIEPACRAALCGGAKRIGVLATQATVNSGAFVRTLQNLDSTAQVLQVACPLFVPLVENGFFDADDPVPQLVAKRYLRPMESWKPDAVILGCTHYPHLRPAIAAALPGVPLIDTGAEVARALRKGLAENNLCTARKTGGLQFFVSDAPESFSAAAQIFLGQTIETVRRVTLIGQTLTPVQQ